MSRSVHDDNTKRLGKHREECLRWAAAIDSIGPTSGRNKEQGGPLTKPEGERKETLEQQNRHYTVNKEKKNVHC